MARTKKPAPARKKKVTARKVAAKDAKSVANMMSGRNPARNPPKTVITIAPRIPIRL